MLLTIKRKENMKTEYILYGLKKNQPDYMEEIICTSYNTIDIKKAKKFAKNCRQFVKFRVATFNGEMPNFADPKLINI